MVDAVSSPLSSWESFYVIVGSSGAALTGLQFVVMALVAELPRQNPAAIEAYGTPTVVHFGVSLLIAAIISAPWPGLWPVSTMLAIVGASGVGYVGVVFRRARAQKEYKPVFEDWLWHNILPFIAYFGIAAGGVALLVHPVGALFIVGAMTLLMLFIGIHNAWDTVMYITTEQLPKARAKKEAQKKTP
jgi:uncharacterized membrane protein YpjA